MKNKFIKITKYLCLILLLVCSFVFIKQSRADSGWDTGYSGGFDTGGWDVGGYGSGGYSHHWNHDYNIGGSSSSSRHSRSQNDFGDIIAAIFLFTVFIIISFMIIEPELLAAKHAKKKKEIDYEQYRKYGDIDYKDMEEEKLKKIMPDYSIADLKEMIYKKFVAIQQAWMEFDYDKLRELCTDELYNTYLTQLEVLKAKKGQNIMSDFVTKYSYIIDVQIENNLYIVKALLRIEFYDYVIDTTTQEVTRGTKNSKVTNTYQLEFVKSVKEEDNKCPNCGAKIESVTSTECAYCGSTIVKKASDFVLSKKNISI